MTTTKLNFCHIPKNAGSAITVSADRVGISWGNNDKEIRRWFRHLGSCPWSNLHRCDYCHVPLRFMLSEELEQVLADHDFFAVVRNPYDKVVSECNWSIMVGIIEETSDKAKLNQFIRHRISQNPDREHWAPQVNFIYDADGRQLVKHVLHYDNLASDFASLMQQYQLPVELGKGINTSPKHFSVKDLEDDTITAINNFYHEDFIKFGYNKR